MKYLTNSGLSYFLNKIKTYLTSSTYLNSIGISNSDIDDIADDAGYSSGSLPASEDVFLTGDIIPNNDNSVDLGASSKNIKMIYTKGITINGTQFLPSDYIPKTGSNQISGDLIPATDNSIDVGSSTNNIKMLYTKDITIDGKTVDTDANGNMTYDGHIVDTIEEQGDRYIRYSNGLQICYGKVVNNNNLGTGIARFSFPKAFSAYPSLVVSPDNSGKWVNTCVVDGVSTWVLYTFGAWMSPIELNGGALAVSYVAIGKWN